MYYFSFFSVLDEHRRGGRKIAKESRRRGEKKSTPGRKGGRVRWR
jgi:hypothetical protein